MSIACLCKLVLLTLTWSYITTFVVASGSMPPDDARLRTLINHDCNQYCGKMSAMHAATAHMAMEHHPTEATLPDQGNRLQKQRMKMLDVAHAFESGPGRELRTAAHTLKSTHPMSRQTKLAAAHAHDATLLTNHQYFAHPFHGKEQLSRDRASGQAMQQYYTERMKKDHTTVPHYTYEDHVKVPDKPTFTRSNSHHRRRHR